MTSAALTMSPQLRLARFEDYPRIQRLEAAHLAPPLPAEQWARLWQDSPLWPRLGRDWPIGWVLEDAQGEVVASLTCLPSLYRFRGQELICASARGWVARPEYRSYAPWLLEEFFNQDGVDLFMSTTANHLAEPIVRTYMSRVPLGDWQTIAYWVTGYRGFAEKAFEKLRVPLAPAWAIPAAAALWLKDSLFAPAVPASLSGLEISASDRFDSRFDDFWEELVRRNPDKLLATRDSRTLAWHFAISLRPGRLWIYTAIRDGLLRAYCVLKRQDRNEGVRRMRVIDYQTLESDVDLLSALLHAARRRCAAEGFYVLEHFGCGLPKMRSFDQFAPYRRKVPSWAYYYRAADPALADEFRRSDAWDPSAYDGDASID